MNLHLSFKEPKEAELSFSGISTYQHPTGLTQHLVLHGAVRVIQVQQELLKEELQMGSTELRVVASGQAGQPQSDGLQGGAANLLAAVVQTLQQLCGRNLPLSR